MSIFYHCSVCFIVLLVFPHSAHDNLRRQLYAYPIFFKDFFFIYLRESTSWGEGRKAGLEAEADSLLSREPNMGLDPRTLKS